MAATYKPIDAIEYGRRFVKGIPVTDVDAQMCDFVQNEIWYYYPWMFTLKQKTKVNDAFLTDKTQDITGVPTDFDSLIRARLRRTDLTDGNYYKELTIADHLEPTNPGVYGSYNLFDFISYESEINKFRLEGQIQIVTNELTQLDIDYQKIPAKILDTGLATVMVDIPDWFFPIFSAGIMWQLMVLANDKRQGAMTITKSGAAVYTGQMGVFYNGLMSRAYSERAQNALFRYPANGSIGAKTYGTGNPNVLG